MDSCPKCKHLSEINADLLAACREVEEFLGQPVPDGGGEVTLAQRLVGLGSLSTLGRVRAAIAKARGGA